MAPKNNKATRKAAPKLTDAERHERFKDMAKELGAEGEAPDFDETLKRLAAQPKDDNRSSRT